MQIHKDISVLIQKDCYSMWCFLLIKWQSEITQQNCLTLLKEANSVSKEKHSSINKVSKLSGTPPKGITSWVEEAINLRFHLFAWRLLTAENKAH